MGEFTKEEWEEEMKADAEQTRQDEHHKRMMQTDFEYFCEHNDSIQVLYDTVEQLDKESEWESIVILEYLTEQFRG